MVYVSPQMSGGSPGRSMDQGAGPALGGAACRSVESHVQDEEAAAS